MLRFGIAFVVGCWLLAGLLGAWVATQRRRSAGEGFLLGVLFGPLGVIVECLLPMPERPRFRPRERTMSQIRWASAPLTPREESRALRWMEDDDGPPSAPEAATPRP